MRIVVLDGHTVNPGDLSWAEWQTLGEVTVYPRTAPGQVVERAAGAEAVITNKVVIDDTVMAQLPHLIYIGVLATGYNVVDVEAARRRGITVTNVPAYSTASVAQMVFAHLLNVTNNVSGYSIGEWQGAPDFCYWRTPQVELAGKVMGIVGMGNTGTAVAGIAQAMGMQVLAYTSRPHPNRAATLDELFANSDVVSLHCPLTPDTLGMVNARRLALMKPTAVLINTGRGPLVDEAALAHALNTGQLAAACLDVLTVEPPQQTPLSQAKNCHITPHIAWATCEARTRLMRAALANLRAHAAGTPINVVS